MNGGRSADSAMPEAKILVVDDDRDLRRLLADGMTDLGYEVSTAADGGEAIDALQKDHFDAVILDLQMSPVNGWAVLESLQAKTYDTLVFLLSAHLDVPKTVSAMRAGAFEVLQKPIRLPELSSRLNEALRSRPKRGRRAPADSPARSGCFKVVTPPVVRQGVARLLGDSREIQRVREQVLSLARFRDVSTLIIGETGTGKEVVAAAIHDLSAPTSPFVSINCAAIPEDLFESELFGYEPGTFTGARGTRPGLLETAEDGTLFLDEVGEMPARLQPKFLRVLQTRSFRRIGGRDERPLRARVVSSTNRKLTAEAQEGMRSDLYFRLAGFTIGLPPLRQRMVDVDILAASFLREFAERYPGLPTRFDDPAGQVLLSYRWPGNVRELRAVVEQAAMLSRCSVVDGEAVLAALGLGRLSFDEHADDRAVPLVQISSQPPSLPPESRRGLRSVPEHFGTDLNQLQRQITIEVFEQHDGNLARTARQLRIPRTTLRDRLRRYGVLSRS